MDLKRKKGIRKKPLAYVETKLDNLSKGEEKMLDALTKSVGERTNMCVIPTGLELDFDDVREVRRKFETFNEEYGNGDFWFDGVDAEWFREKAFRKGKVSFKSCDRKHEIVGIPLIGAERESGSQLFEITARGITNIHIDGVNQRAKQMGRYVRSMDK